MAKLTLVDDLTVITYKGSIGFLTGFDTKIVKRRIVEGVFGEEYSKSSELNKLGMLRVNSKTYSNKPIVSKIRLVTKGKSSGRNYSLFYINLIDYNVTIPINNAHSTALIGNNTMKEGYIEGMFYLVKLGAEHGVVKVDSKEGKHLLDKYKEGKDYFINLKKLKVGDIVTFEDGPIKFVYLGCYWRVRINRHRPTNKAARSYVLKPLNISDDKLEYNSFVIKANMTGKLRLIKRAPNENIKDYSHILSNSLYRSNIELYFKNKDALKDILSSFHAKKVSLKSVIKNRSNDAFKYYVNELLYIKSTDEYLYANSVGINRLKLTKVFLQEKANTLTVTKIINKDIVPIRHTIDNSSDKNFMASLSKDLQAAIDDISILFFYVTVNNVEIALSNHHVLR